MKEQSLIQKLEWFSVTSHVPERGYKGLLSEALHEINRLVGLQAPVTCMHCKRTIDRADDWYRCTDCDGHYHKSCIAQHAKDWLPSHPARVTPAFCHTCNLSLTECKCPKGETPEFCAGCGFAHLSEYPDCVWIKDLG